MNTPVRADAIVSWTDVDVTDRRVLIREDFNVPMRDGKITQSDRIDRALPTILAILQRGAKQVILMSHFGRPSPGEYDPQYSLAPIQAALAERLALPVELCDAPWDRFPSESPIVLLENTRFWVGELENDSALSERLAALADVFVMDAFATAHRAHASTVGVAQASSIACAGPLLEEELAAMERALGNPQKPVVAIVGGAKVSTKIKLIDALLEQVNTLIVGGGIANTFLLAMGCPIGHSLAESDCVTYAKHALKKAADLNVDIVLPQDVVVADHRDAEESIQCVDRSSVKECQAIFDVGPKTGEQYQQVLQSAATILWNGPVGLFEKDAFAVGTATLAKQVAASKAYSIAGGGDTLAAVEQFGVSSEISYISTGGGAFLAWCEGETLPAVESLKSPSEIE